MVFLLPCFAAGCCALVTGGLSELFSTGPGFAPCGDRYTSSWEGSGGVWGPDSLLES